jgi:hypothetical protein
MGVGWGASPTRALAEERTLFSEISASCFREKSKRGKDAPGVLALLEQTRQKKWGGNGAHAGTPCNRAGGCRHGHDHPRAPVVQVHSCPQDTPRYTPAGVEGFIHPQAPLTVKPVAHKKTEEESFLRDPQAHLCQLARSRPAIMDRCHRHAATQPPRHGVSASRRSCATHPRQRAGPTVATAICRQRTTPFLQTAVLHAARRSRRPRGPCMRVLEQRPTCRTCEPDRDPAPPSDPTALRRNPAHRPTAHRAAQAQARVSDAAFMPLLFNRCPSVIQQRSNASTLQRLNAQEI